MARWTAAEAAERWIRVGRWMSQEELRTMLDTGFAQESEMGGSRIAEPADINAYRAAPEGDLYVEYDVPAGSTIPGGGPGWSKIPGPNSTEGRLAVSKGLPPPQMPPVKNIQVVSRDE
jgi:hypothetical protein